MTVSPFSALHLINIVLIDRLAMKGDLTRAFEMHRRKGPPPVPQGGGVMPCSLRKFGDRGYLR
jgi:hypothetical protein